MSDLSSLPFTQLLITRFCHDITGPIGAVNNGVEFLNESPNMQAQAMSLIADSAAQAMVRIQFYRYLYGMLKESGVADFNEKKKLAEDFYKGSRINIEWQEQYQPLGHAECRVLCNLILLTAATLIKGGIVTVELQATPESLKEMVITAKGELIKMDTDLITALLGKPNTELSSKTVQAYYTSLLIQEQQAVLHLDITEAAAVFTYKASL